MIDFTAELREALSDFQDSGNGAKATSRSRPQGSGGYARSGGAGGAARSGIFEGTKSQRQDGIRTTMSDAASNGQPEDHDPFLSMGNGPDRPSLAIEDGTRLDRFVVRRPLGTGRTSAVYLAHDTVRGEDVAIKVMALELGRRTVAMERMERERSVNDRITDLTHVLRAYDVYQVPWGGIDLLLLSMQYADGGSLRTWLNDRQQDSTTQRTQGLEYFRQICRGVAAIHNAGAVHRDLKPQNILFVGGVAKVADLGAAGGQLHAAVCNPESDTDHEFDRGTPIYMAPEQFTAAHPDDPDIRADTYSLGVILYELLHPRGRPPFGGSFNRLRELHTQVCPPPLPDTDERYVRVVRRCLEKDPNDRFQSVHELVYEMDGRNETTPDPKAELAEQVEASWREAMQSVDQQKYARAMDLARNVLDQNPEHEHAGHLLAELQRRFDRASELYGAVNQTANASNLDEQLTLLAEAVDLFPDHPAGHLAQVRLELKSREYRQAIEQALASAREGHWSEARSWLGHAKDLNAGATEVERPLRLINDACQFVDQTRSSIDQAIRDGNESRAVSLARDLDDYVEQVTQSITADRDGNHRPTEVPS